MTTFRTATGGRIDRDTTLEFTFDGQPFTGHPGDTLASALLASGRHQIATSVKLGRPRGVTAAWAEDSGGLVQIEEPFPEPMQLATTIELHDGLVAHGLPGQGRLADVPDSARYDAVHHHVDVLVVGAGPAGLAAALSAARAVIDPATTRPPRTPCEAAAPRRAVTDPPTTRPLRTPCEAAAPRRIRIALIDEQSEAGGSLLSGTDRLDDAPALDWVAAAVAELAEYPDVLHLQRTTAFGSYDDGFVLALERRTDHLGTAAPKHLSRQRVWRIRARSIVVATGAHERPVVFADNDRPGIMLAGAAQTFLNRYGVLPGREAVVFTTNDSAYDAALDLHRAGVRVSAVVDARTAVPARLLDQCERAGIPVLRGSVVTGTRGSDRSDHDASSPDSVRGGRPASDQGRVTHALVAPFLGGEVGEGRAIACDLLLVSGGWNPAVHLFSQARGRLRYDERLGAFVPGEELEGLTVAGAAAGLLDLAGCLADGQRVARETLTGLGVEPARGEQLPTAATSGTPGAPLIRRGAAGSVTVLWRVPDPSGAGGTTQFVDLQRDATVADITRAVGAGLRSIEHIKRYTTIGTAHDQGKTSGVITSGITAELLGIPVQDTGTTTFRPPYTPVAFAALAGRDRGRLFDPERVTALHDWHVTAGAVFEDVGQWKRPRFYPQPGEDVEAAVLRECAATRTGVGILDGSTLGKIDVQGPDAGVLLDMLYTNMMSNVKVGSVRYGVMCGVDGMVIDDGTVLRLAGDRFLVLTTTGGAAKILDWMEEWLQTEWPQLRVHCTSVTEQWATFPVVGPRSRDVIGAVFPDVDVSKEAFPFMTWRDTSLDGIPVRLARISFSGELAYEVYVSPWYAVAVWQRLVEAGRPYGITPYGTETMHVLRAEKGYPIIGQDTDGTVTPQDLGMSWAISKKKPDFVGKRSFARPANQDPLRKQLVGLLPVDRQTVLPEGSQIVEFCAGDQLPPPPVPMLGHVTSSYRSAELERPFALALVKGGRSRIGETVHVPVNGTLVPVEVTGSVLVDPEGARRDG